MRILLAFNGSRASDAALRAVIASRRPENTEVLLLNVALLDDTEPETSEPHPALAAAAAALRAAGFLVKTRVIRDIVVDGIVRISREWDADLIVLGWHGRTSLKLYFFGGVADAVVRGAPCSVELIRFRPERCESEKCRHCERGAL